MLRRSKSGLGRVDLGETDNSVLIVGDSGRRSLMLQILTSALIDGARGYCIDLSSIGDRRGGIDPWLEGVATDTDEAFPLVEYLDDELQRRREVINHWRQQHQAWEARTIWDLPKIVRKAENLGRIVVAIAWEPTNSDLPFDLSNLWRSARLFRHVGVNDEGRAIMASTDRLGLRFIVSAARPEPDEGTKRVTDACDLRVLLPEADIERRLFLRSLAVQPTRANHDLHNRLQGASADELPNLAFVSEDGGRIIETKLRAASADDLVGALHSTAA